MAVIRVVREHEVGRKRLQLLEDPLYVAADVGEKAVAEVVDVHLRTGRPLQKRLGAPARLGVSIAARAENDPADIYARQRLDQGEERSAAPDLDVVGVADDREEPAGGRWGAQRCL